MQCLKKKPSHTGLVQTTHFAKEFGRSRSVCRVSCHRLCQQLPSLEPVFSREDHRWDLFRIFHRVMPATEFLKDCFSRCFHTDLLRNRSLLLQNLMVSDCMCKLSLPCDPGLSVKSTLQPAEESATQISAGTL